MRISDCIGCTAFPCQDVRHAAYSIPEVEIDPAGVKIILVSEAAPAERGDGYYAGGDSLFERTTVLAFQDAGARAASIHDILDLGVYLTTAIKCAKTGYGIQSKTTQTCARILEQELALFPNSRVLLLMGDVAIKAINEIARRAGARRVIPATPTYKLRGQVFYFQGKRVFPSYLQAGPSFFIEKSKRRMIAEDIQAALASIQD
jgi:uracil-DNA glycosylase